jgi:hypothetical protein
MIVLNSTTKGNRISITRAVVRENLHRHYGISESTGQDQNLYPKVPAPAYMEIHRAKRSTDSGVLEKLRANAGCRWQYAIPIMGSGEDAPAWTEETMAGTFVSCVKVVSKSSTGTTSRYVPPP